MSLIAIDRVIQCVIDTGGRWIGSHGDAIDAKDELSAIRHAARVLTRPMEFTTDEYVKASALLKALAEEAE